MRRRVWLACAFVTVSVAAPIVSAAPDEAADVLAAVNKVFAAMAAHDAAAVKAVVEDDAVFINVRPGPDGVPVTRRVTGADFAAAVGRPGEPWIERLVEPEVRVHNGLAIVWSAYDFHRAGVLSHCGKEVFTLLKRADGWKVVHVADTYDRPCTLTLPPSPEVKK